MGILGDQLSIISATAKTAQREAAQKQLDAAFEWLSALCVREARAGHETATCTYMLNGEYTGFYAHKEESLPLPEINPDTLLQLMKERVQQENMNISWKSGAGAIWVTARWGSKNQ